MREQPQGALLYAACLLQGHECQADPAAALELLLTATESHAANYLIARQWQLQGKDHAGMEAVYRAAARAGSACSALRLGELAREAGNADDARKWFSQAAEASCIPAMMALAAMQEAGEGAAADKDAALGWYRKAAAAGNKDAEAKVRQLEK
ncbi:MAG: hypothetical protein IT463_11295 [Planctomycetes bacterium]|nr:hypothetical protein [Planctomycetota bacterium]